MGLEKVKVISQITILEKGQIQVRVSSRVLEDGVQIAPDQYHRYVLEPGADLTDQPDIVKAQAEAAWTPEVLQAWQDLKLSQQIF